MKIICAFSSDFRELYQADIYRALALPTGSVVHFRYKKRYVDGNLLSSQNLTGKKTAIFYSPGNKNDGTPSTENISIRYATIVNQETSEDTDVFHVYLKLDHFCNLRIDSTNAAEKLPSNCFLSEIDCTAQAQDSSWQGRVLAVADYLRPLTFLHIKEIVSENGNAVALKYFNNSRNCRYCLIGGERYVARLILANPKGVAETIHVAESSSLVAINAVNPLLTSANFDDFDVPLIVRELQSRSIPSLITFCPRSGELQLNEYATNVELELRSGLKRPLLFGLLTIFAGAGIYLAQPVNPATIPVDSWRLLLAALLVGGASSVLYTWFNKK